MRGIIYKYTSPSGKVYIGQTRSESTRRAKWFNDKAPYAGPKINAARLKYGPTNFKYESSIDASIELGISSGNISQVLNGKRKVAGDYIFTWKTNDNFPRLINTSGKLNRTLVGKYSTDGTLIETYRSITEASKKNNVNRNTLGKYIKNNIDKTLGGFIWKEVTNA